MTAPPTGPARRDIAWSAIGTLLPAVAALWAVPQYTETLGAERFGVLALVWSLVGWFSVADLGLSRAVTHGVARALARDDAAHAGAVSWSALAVMVPVAVVGGGVLAASAPWVVGHLTIDEVFALDTVASLRWVGIAIPLTVVVTALRGVVEGTGAFRILGLVRAPIGIAFALVPLAFLRGEARVALAVQGIVAVRAVALVVHAGLALHLLPTLRPMRFVGRAEFQDLLSFGGWTTVVQSVGPLLNMMDRLLLGVFAPVVLLAPYGVASEAGIRVWLLAAVILPVQYAWYAGALVRSPAEAVQAYVRGLRLLAVVGLPVLLVAVVAAAPLMRWWVGSSIGSAAAPLLGIMSIGLMANLVAQGAQTFVQAAGRPAYTAIGYLWQLPITVLALMVAISHAGALGAAWVWTARFLIDAVWSGWMAEHAVPEARVVRFDVVTILLLPPLVLAGVVLFPWLTVG